MKAKFRINYKKSLHVDPEGIISWSIKSSKKKQNKSKVNLVSLGSFEQDKEKVQTATKKAFFKKETYCK